MDILLSIARNGALLLSLIFIYSLFVPQLMRSPRILRSLITGVLFGIFAILNMLEPLRFSDGVMIDPRNVILMLAAALGGFRAGLTTFGIVAAYRFYIGGSGLEAGLASMLTAVIIGIIYNRYKRTKRDIVLDRDMLLVLLAVAVESLLWTISLPDNLGWTLLPRISIPVLTAYTLSGLVMVWLLDFAYQRLDLTANLSDSERRFRAIFLQSQSYLILMLPDGAIEYLNPVLSSAAMLLPEELIGKRFWEVNWAYLPENARQMIRAGVEEAAKGESQRILLELTPEAQTIILDTSFQPILDEQGIVQHILMTSRDITAQLHAEKRQLELEFERERGNILQDLLTNGAHHLRTPLSIMTSSIYLLENQVSKLLELSKNPQTPADALEKWETKLRGQFLRLDTARQDLVEIVEDLLNMMQLDNPSKFRFEPTQLAVFAKEILDEYQDRAKEKGLHLQLKMPSQALVAAIAPDAFRKLLCNLIENSLRYTATGGSVVLSLEVEGSVGKLLLEDTGIGIPEAELSRIFERFYRTTNASDQSLKGTGLGLAIVKKVVEMHEGDIAIESQIGQGTKVIVTIPLLPSPSVAAAS